MKKQLPVLEFHVSRVSRDRFQFDQSLFTSSGNVIFANFYSARLFTQKMNQKRDLVNYPEQAVRAGQINAMGMIDEILHYVVQLYREQLNPDCMANAYSWLVKRNGQETLDRALIAFADEFPTTGVYQGRVTPHDYFHGETEGIPNRLVVLEEMLMLWLTNANPAMDPYLELFDDARLAKVTAYPQIIVGLQEFFKTQPPFGPESLPLVDLLRSPAIAVPNSLSGQLEYIREKWGGFLGRYLYRLLASLDLIKEEEKAIFLGPGPVQVPSYAGSDLEIERFSLDRDWMPNLVLIAKNSYVWLDQLSKRYQRSIYRLDQIPDTELETLSRWGFSGLWLIGIWERSPASARIKQLTGNPEAVASAYSLAAYDIAADLGGYEAYNHLREKAWQHGIRLASDMVPNHMGIDSSWVVEHPDWFLSLDYSPYPSYSFNGPDLSQDSRVGIFIEDHYYNRTDAAVVFKRLDRWTGSEKYIYHGNDGTSMPWNDTAQLNYLNPEVREAVIQAILHVARQFQIIRFDAAMTLAKKHYQRLWYPEPGSGGAIPTRAENGLTQQQFDAAMPEEFWREVVERVAREVPDTLLLAEAFWLMEGYFVRTLGMHRVYNSAFMNLLRNEDNAKFRSIIKTTLEFDPEILKRFVNFMNNPDERTAVDQFGKGDKYFGICTLMSTFPGLPMFGHGQVEGYTEKYGMEYRKAYWDETPDAYLVQRHEREIFPLLHRRWLFANVDHFLLYDFFTPEGYVNEDVYAFSNGAGSERTLVVYHNRFASVKGWIRVSAAFSERLPGGGRQLTQRTLGEGLAIPASEDHYLFCRDLISGLEYIRPAKELHEKGLYLELNAYKAHVFADLRLVQDDSRGQYRQLFEYLQGRGVPNIEEALTELLLQPIHQPFTQLVNPGMFFWMIENASLLARGEQLHPNFFPEIDSKIGKLGEAIRSHIAGSRDPLLLTQEVRRKLETALSFPMGAIIFSPQASRKLDAALDFVQSHFIATPENWFTLFSWVFVHDLGKMADHPNPGEVSRAWIDEWQLGRILVGLASDMGIPEAQTWQSINRIQALVLLQDWHEKASRTNTFTLFQTWLAIPEFQRALGINRYREVLWYNQEAFEEFLMWLLLVALVDIVGDPQRSDADQVDQLRSAYAHIQRLQAAQANSEYRVDRILAAIQRGKP